MTVCPAIRAARVSARGSTRVILSTLIVSTLLWAPGAYLAFGGPKRPQVPAFWGPIYPIWNIALDGIPVGRPAFDRTSVYVGLRDGRLAAVSLTTGGVLWSTNQGVTAPPAALEGLVLAVKGATLIGLDSANGDVRWQQALGAPSVLAPTVGPNWIAVITTKPELLLLQPTDGRLLWRQALAAPARALPTGDTDRIFIGLTNGQAMALSASNGAAQWTRKVGGEPLVLTLNRDRVFVGTSDDFLCALVTGSGKQKWRWRTGGDVGGAVAADDTRVYFASLDNSLVALGRAGGDLKWEQRLPSRPVGGPVLIGDTLILATVAKELKTFAIDRGTLTETVRLPGRPLHQPHLVPWTGPVPPRAIVLTAGGQLLAMGPVVEPPVGPLDPMPGNVMLLPEALAPIEPPLVRMLYPPGKLLLPETLPPAAIRKIPTRRP
jgi:outer membrane protein assembly factor BamB